MSENKNIASRVLELEKQHVNLQHKLQNRILCVVLFFGIFVSSLLTYDVLYPSENELSTGQFITQNLQGDSINTWLYWNIIDHDAPFHIHVINDAKIDKEKMQSVYQSILSTEFIRIEDSVLHKGPKGKFSNFYLGWAGAMNAASDTDTKYFLPTNFHVHENSLNDGDIVITLTKSKNAEGYTGYTRSLVDENQILKSYITIYQADILPDHQLAAILRHELGHAFGLIHSTDSHDLMYEKILTNVPYISECSIDALKELYNGNTDYSHNCE